MGVLPDVRDPRLVTIRRGGLLSDAEVESVKLVYDDTGEVREHREADVLELGQTR